MRPNLVPVGCDLVAGCSAGGELERTRRAVVVARDGRVRGVGDGVAIARDIISTCYPSLLFPHKGRGHTECVKASKMAQKRITQRDSITKE